MPSISVGTDIARPLPPRRRTRWLSYLWVRIGIVLMLITVISLFVWWLPRRTAIAVRWHFGTTMCHDDFKLAQQLRSRILTSPGKWTLEELLNLAQWLSIRQPDEATTWVDLSNTNVGDHWLVRLKRFPKLRFVGLDDRQLGAGLSALEDHTELTCLTVHGASSSHLAELRRLPQLQELELVDPASDDLGLTALGDLKSFTRIAILDCKHSATVIEQLQNLTDLQQIEFENSMNMTDDALSRLSQQAALKNLCIHECSPIGDAGLEHLSRIENLDTLVLTGSLDRLTDNGVRALARLKKLSQLVVSRRAVTADQVQSLERLMPNCKLTVR